MTLNRNQRLYLVIPVLLIMAVVVVFFIFKAPEGSPLYVTEDALDPFAGFAESLWPGEVRLVDPFELGNKLGGLKGAALVFSSQAEELLAQESYDFLPLYTAHIVIAVNKDGKAAGLVDGWHSLLTSRGKVFMPHNATEGGRLAAMAMAKGLGAEEGDYEPALRALAVLHSEGHLNGPYDYYFDELDYMYNPEDLPLFDAVVMWDYQAEALLRLSDRWDVVAPKEGDFAINCGVLWRLLPGETDASLRGPLASALADETQLSSLGFSPISPESDVSGWGWERLVYNPKFRRSVLGIKLRGPASLLERLALQSIVFIAFAIGALHVTASIRAEAQRRATLSAMLLLAFWLLIGIVKALSLDPHFARYLWFATYIPRHFLPLAWYAMCYANRFDKLPPKTVGRVLAAVALLFTLLVFTNDWHRQVFVYTTDNSEVWKNYYTHAWGYYGSIVWSLSILSAGLFQVIRNEKTHRRRRQFIYGSSFIGGLAIYQLAYILGNKYILDLDIPVTVAVFFLVFSWAARQERFLGATLLDLPIFSHSGYGLAVFGQGAELLLMNESMQKLHEQDTGIPRIFADRTTTSEWPFGGRNYRVRVLRQEAGRVVMLEDVTQLRQLELSLQKSHRRLKALSSLLLAEAEASAARSSSLVRQGFSDQLEVFFRGTLLKLQNCMREAVREEGAPPRAALTRIRFMISVCQQRLRLILQSQDAGLPFSPSLLADYAEGLTRAGARFGLDAVFIRQVSSHSIYGVPMLLLEVVDRVLFEALNNSDLALICRLCFLEGMTEIAALFSCEASSPGDLLADSFAGLMAEVQQAGGRVETKKSDDSLAIHFSFSATGGASDGV